MARDSEKAPLEFLQNPIGYLWKQICCIKDKMITKVYTEDSASVTWTPDRDGTEDSPIQANFSGGQDVPATFTNDYFDL